jgi:hypothetical protein
MASTVKSAAKTMPAGAVACSASCMQDTASVLHRVERAQKKYEQTDAFLNMAGRLARFDRTKQ